MNNVFKRRFRRKLCISELLEICENCAKTLHDNELDEDHKSRNSTPVTYIPHLPMLKTAAKSYIREIFIQSLRRNSSSNFLSLANCYNLRGQLRLTR